MTTNATAGVGAVFERSNDTSTTLDGAAAASQKVVPVSATTGFTVGDECYIRSADGSKFENVTIASMVSGTNITVQDNLTQSYSSGDIFGHIYETVSEINSIGGPNQSKATIDVTSLDSVGGRREFIGSFIDSGEISLEMNFTRTQWSLFKDDLGSNVARCYRIKFPDTSQTAITFFGLVTAIGSSIPLDDKITQSVTIKITGDLYVT